MPAPIALEASMWWDSHADYVDVDVGARDWTDRIGGEIATQTTGTKQPAPGSDAEGPFLSFARASQQSLVLPAAAVSILASGSFTIVVKGSVPTFDGSIAIYNSYAGVGSTTAAEFISFAARGDRRMASVNKTVATSFQISLGALNSLTAGVTFTSAQRWNGSTGSLVLDGALATWTNARTVNPTVDTGRIGAVVSSGAEADHYNGKIRHIVLFDRVLSDPEAVRVTSEL